DGRRERSRSGLGGAAADPGGRRCRPGHASRRTAFCEPGHASHRARSLAPAFAVHPVGTHPPAPNRAPLRPAVHRRAGRAEPANHAARDPDRTGGARGRRGSGRSQSPMAGAPPLRRPLRRFRGFLPVADRARRRLAGGRLRPRRAAARGGPAARRRGGGGPVGGGGRDHRTRERRPRGRGGGRRRRRARPSGAGGRRSLALGRGGRGRRRHGGRRARVPAAFLAPRFRGGGRPGGTRAGRARWEDANRL
ncbi:MAG: Putative heme iron utilization protein, partial [uncultured Acetobacteraceae bacterium]